MCGISGYYSPDSLFSKQDIENMSGLMNHRGPDNRGYFIKEKVALAHNRLSIIDLSTEANQPMFSHNEKCCIVFNGEIYNYREIASELNLKWKTHSDTEVVLEAFVKWGPEFVEKLNGMFALAIIDIETNNLFLFRDRIGIKPLFYFFDGKNFLFSSELKAIRQIVKKYSALTLNNKSINEFLHLGYIPEPDTIYEEINKFPSGKYAIINNHGLQLKRYWQLKTHLKPEIIKNENEAKTQLKQLLENSVRKRLISDVPYGTFLSGGVDSSLVTAIAQKVSTQKIKTFSIGFKESKYNEAEYAKSVAKYLNTGHHEFIVSYSDAIELIDSLDSAYDEPFADSSAIPTMLVSKMAKQYVTMTLSGDGGDELFHGYGSYIWANRLSNPLVKFTRKPVSSALSLLPNRYKRISKLVNYKNRRELPSHIFSQEQYFFSRSEIKEILHPGFYENFKLKERHHEIKHFLSPAENQALFDFNYYLKDDLLVKVDRASMKYSLETRVPLLDHKIVEYALNIAPELKIKNGIQKYILKQVLYDYIPAELFNRPKWGFSIPLNQWLKNELSYLIDEYLSRNIIEKYSIVRWSYVSELIYKFRNKDYNYLYNRVWLLIVLHKWLEKNN
ncbi:MAG: asparagine synthase (glutamine-hydrolyzing) [Chlorobi bacterium]|nr:asparagine synthase (glutamine-hydrolyzing) [Chlorobiota bacterium]